MSTKTLYRSADKDEMLARIQRLEPDSAAQWGKMSVAQMLAHCQQPLRVATDELKLKRGLIGILFGRIAKKQLLQDKPFKPNLPTSPEFVVVDVRDFARERQQLIVLIERFAAAGPSGLPTGPHPFFGVMTQAEWEALMWKHLDHHLRQFGSA
jgi:hypothetical protein